MAVIGTSKTLQKHRLSIRATAGGFSFLITDALSGEVWRRNDIPVGKEDQTAALLERALDALPQEAFTSVEVVMNTPSTRIPLDEFHRDELTTLYRIVFPTFDMAAMDLCYTILPTLEVAELFALRKDVRAAVARRFPLATYHNVCGLALEDIAHHDRTQNATPRTLYAHVDDATLLLASFESHNLVFANNYPAAHHADAVYFTLYTFQTLALDAHHDRVILSGDDDDLKEEVRKYVKNVAYRD